VPQFDERNRDFRLVAPTTVRGRTWQLRTRLDQGQDGACVGFGWSHELASQPKVYAVTNDSARGLYEQAKTLDDFPGTDYEGTSVLAGAKACVARGAVSVYQWAFTVDEVMQAITHHGPVVLGTDWLTNMFYPDAHGLLNCAGPVAGGHCYLARGLLMRPSFASEPVLRCTNSWGSGWGHFGEFFLKASDLESLLSTTGEACVPTDSPLK
jgi:hypothetical protein